MRPLTSAILVVITLFCYMPLSATPDSLYQVGMVTRNYTDNIRQNWLGNAPRPLRTIIWYPAAGGTVNKAFGHADQFTTLVQVFSNSHIVSAKKRYPLIVLSHGANGNAMQMAWLGYYLAARGYIVAAINHSGTPEEERHTVMPTISDFCLWEHPRDINAVLDKVLSDSVFKAVIDQQRIGVAGFSLGGASAIWVTGPRLNLKELAANSPLPDFMKPAIEKMKVLADTDPVINESRKHAEASFKNTRFKGAFALAPAIGQGFTKAGLSDATVPVRIVVGDADVVTPAATNAKIYADSLPHASLTILPGEIGHITRPQQGNEAAIALEKVSAMAYDFFETLWVSGSKVKR